MTTVIKKADTKLSRFLLREAREGIKQPDIAEPMNRSKNDIVVLFTEAKTEASSPAPQKEASTEERIIPISFAIAVMATSTAA